MYLLVYWWYRWLRYAFSKLLIVPKLVILDNTFQTGCKTYTLLFNKFYAKEIAISNRIVFMQKGWNSSKNILILSVCLLFAMLLQKCVAVKANYFKKDLGNNADVSQHLTVTEVEDTGMVKCAGIALWMNFVLDLHWTNWATYVQLCNVLDQMTFRKNYQMSFMLRQTLILWTQHFLLEVTIKVISAKVNCGDRLTLT